MAGLTPVVHDGAASALPVHFQKPGRRQLIEQDYGVLGCLRDRSRDTTQVVEHPLGQIAQIGGARPEVVVVRTFVVADLGLEQMLPGGLCILAVRNGLHRG